jgi:hypothetical protein
MLVTEKQLSPCSRDMAFTGDRFVGVVNFTSMLIEDNVLQHCSRPHSVTQFRFSFSQREDRKHGYGWKCHLFDEETESLDKYQFQT